MEAKAIARYVRISPRKARIVVDQIRGKSVVAARETLQFINRAAAEPVAKTLDSAVANACYVDEGPTLKRFRPRAKGSASRINKRTCHITVIVGTREEA